MESTYDSPTNLCTSDTMRKVGFWAIVVLSELLIIVIDKRLRPVCTHAIRICCHSGNSTTIWHLNSLLG